MRTVIIIFTLLLMSCKTNLISVGGGGTGRYLQASQDGQLFLQIDLNSFAACKAEVETVKHQNSGNFDMLCNTVTLNEMLPYSFTTTVIVTDLQYSITRLKSMDACLLMRKQIQRGLTPEYYRVNECNRI